MIQFKVAIRVLAIIGFCAAFALCQPAPPSEPWSPPPGESALGSKLACAGLRSLTGYELTIATATLIPAAAGVPEHCRISGQILPEIRFEVNLPTSWNRRLYMFGNGGFAGEPIDSGRWGHGEFNRNRALQH